MAVTRPTEIDAPPGETIEELFAALESPLLAYALRLLNDRDIAEDVVQEAFMKLHVHFKEVREPRKWLYRTVHNQSLNHRRQSAKTISFDGLKFAQTETSESTTPETTDPQPLPDELLTRLEGVGLVQLSLAALDDRSRELIRLKFTEDLSYKEISARTGLKIGHVGYLLHHALKEIAGELAKNGVVP